MDVDLNGIPHVFTLTPTAIVLSAPSASEPVPTTTTTTIEFSSIAFLTHTPTTNSLSVTYLSFADPSSPPDDAAVPLVHTLVLNPGTSASARLSDLLSSPQLSPLLLPSLPTPSASPASPRKLSVILNSSAGAGTAALYFSKVVEPFLVAAGVTFEKWDTEGVGHAGVLGGEIVRKAKASSMTVLLVGGDGTSHEFVNGVLQARGDGMVESSEVDIILLPLGTANAFYHHLFPPERGYDLASPNAKLHSLLAFIRGNDIAREGVTLAKNSILRPSPPSPSPSSFSPSPPIYTLVVTSFALHASILSTAESLRPTHPNLSRFKLAASLNASRWTSGTLSLPPSSSSTLLYDLPSRSFRPLEPHEREVEGPFSYLTAALVDRFEPTFVIAPFRAESSELGPEKERPSIDIVVIRPMRDEETGRLLESESVGEEEGKEVGGDGGKAVREAFVAKIWGAMGGAYDGGKHVDKTYEGENGVEIVEYYRVPSFEWAPAPSDEPKDHLVCLDGALEDVGEGGVVRTEALGAGTTGLSVWGAGQ